MTVLEAKKKRLVQLKKELDRMQQRAETDCSLQIIDDIRSTMVIIDELEMEVMELEKVLQG